MAGKPDHDPLLAPLVGREREILRLLAEGCSNTEIAQKLYLAVETVKWYNKQLFSKLGVGSRTQAVARASELGLFDAPEAATPAPSHPPHNLPVEPMPFIGRTRELNEVAELVADPACRLVTLTGPGGIGKTRLGLKVAEQHLNAFEHGVFFVPLAGVGSPDWIVSAVAGALKFRLDQSSEPKDQLIGYLTQKHMLLVLDNFEHLLDGSGLVAEVVAASPGVQVIATSRVRLSLAAECVYPVDGLNVPPSPEHVVFEDVEAVQMFAAYARRARPDFALAETDKAAVVEICKLVGGSPLGIELAAAWVRALSPGDIAQELKAGLDLLAGEMRDLPERQRSIRATFEYSWKMLTPEQQSALRRLAVFRGGFTREAAKAVAGFGIVTLRGLVDQSFVKLGGGGRYDIHELIRQFGEEKLAQSGEENAIHRAHAAYFVALAEQASPNLWGPDAARWWACLGEEHDNLRTALGWAVDGSQAATAVSLCAALRRFWVYRGHLNEGQRWLDQALALEGDVPPRIRAEALRGRGSLAAAQGDFSRARLLVEQGLALFQQLEDTNGVADCHINLGEFALSQGDYAQARPHFENSLALHRKLREGTHIAMCIMYLGSIASDLGQFATARQHLEESLALFREVEDRVGIGGCMSVLGLNALRDGDYAQAQSYAKECLAIAREFDIQSDILLGWYVLAMAALRQGDCAAARSYVREAFPLMQAVEYRWHIPGGLEGMAALAAAEGQPLQAARLLGAAQALREALHLPPLPPADRPALERDVETVRAQLDEAAFNAAWAEGRAMWLDEAIQAAQEYMRKEAGEA